MPTKKPDQRKTKKVRKVPRSEPATPVAGPQKPVRGRTKGHHDGRKKALAEALGLSAQALNHHLRSADHPAIDDLPAWRLHLASVSRHRGPGGKLVNGDDSGAQLSRKIALARKRMLEASARKLERLEQVAAAKLMPVEGVREGVRVAMSELFGVLERTLCGELPPALLGMEEVEMRSKIQRCLDDSKAACKELFRVMVRDEVGSKEAENKT